MSTILYHYSGAVNKVRACIRIYIFMCINALLGAKLEESVNTNKYVSMNMGYMCNVRLVI